MATKWRRKRERRCNFKEKISLEEAHHHMRPWIRAQRKKEMNEGRRREEHKILCSKRALKSEVKQMAAAAAAAGQAISAFENELRPIDRYAIRFMELWDPIIDKTALESEVRIEDTEWELDRIEKYKEEMEAEIDEDEEPLVYESMHHITPFAS